MPQKYSIVLVIAQFVLIGLVLGLSNWSVELLPIKLFLAAPGLMLGVWAVWTKRRELSVFPDPTAKMKLITSGPFAAVRHPMYLAVLTVTLSATIASGSIVWALWLALLLVLIAKMNHEERLLGEQFSNYEAYRKRSKRLVPGIY